MGNTQSNNQSNFVTQNDWDFFKSNSGSFPRHDDWGHFGKLAPLPSPPSAPVSQPPSPAVLQPSSPPTVPPVRQPSEPSPDQMIMEPTVLDDDSDFNVRWVSERASVSQPPVPPVSRPPVPPVSRPSGTASLATAGTASEEDDSTPVFDDVTSLPSAPPSVPSPLTAPPLPSTLPPSTLSSESSLQLTDGDREEMDKFGQALDEDLEDNETDIIQPTQTQLGDEELENLLRLPRAELQRRCQSDSRINTLICSQNFEMNRFWMHKTMHDRTRRIAPDQVAGFEGFKPSDDWLMINFLKTAGIEFKSMRNLAQLTGLDLSGNRPGIKKISKLPYRGLRLLEYNLETNEQREVPWENLKFLDLSHNNLSDFPEDGLGIFPRLREIDLRHNNFSAFPFNLGVMPNLEKVYLGGNPTTSITDEHLAYARQHYPELEYVFKADEPVEKFEEPTGGLMEQVQNVFG